MFRAAFCALLLLLGIAGASAQSRPVIQLDAPPPAPLYIGDVSKTPGMEIFEDSALPDDPALHLAEIVVRARAYDDEFYTRPLGRTVDPVETLEQTCNGFDAMIDTWGGYQGDRAVLLAGARSGVLSLDDVAGPVAVEVTNRAGEATVVEIGRTGEDALTALAAHPGIAPWLKTTALGMLKFTRGVRQEVDLLRYLNWYCSDQSPGTFVFAGDGCDAADADYARETYARFDDDAFDFLLSVGVRDITLRCVRINVISSLNEFDALRIEDAYVEDLSITASRIANVTIANVIGDGRIELDDTVISGAVVLRLVYGSPSLSLLRSTTPDLQVSEAELGAINLTSASLGSVSFDALRADTISFRQADISEAVRLGDVESARSVYFNEATSDGLMRIIDLRIGTEAFTEDPRTESLYFTDAEIKNGITVANAVIDGDVIFSGGVFGDVALVNSRVARNVSLAGARSDGPIVLGEGGGGIVVEGQLQADQVEASSLNLFDANILGRTSLREAQISGELAIWHSALYGSLSITSMSVGRLSIRAIATDTVSLTGTRVAGGVEIFNLLAQTVFGDRLTAGYIDVNAVSAFYGTAASFVEVPGPCFDSELVNARQPNIMTDDDYTRLGLYSGDAKSYPPGCIDVLDLQGARIDGNLTIEGTIETAANLNATSIGGELMLAGAATQFGERACVTARGMRADTIIYDVEATGDARGPKLVDLYGTDFRMLRGSQPFIAGRATWADVHSYLNRFLGNGTERCDSYAGIQVNDTGAGGFQPAIYDALATGLERNGDLDQARKVRITKNRDYARTLVFSDDVVGNLSVLLTMATYWVADNVSGYGYDNLRAVIWLVGLITVGAILGWIGERRIASVLDPILLPLRHRLRVFAMRTFGWRYQSPGPEPGEGVVRRRPVRLAGWAFSLDRSVPSLSLDSAFSSHEGLGPYLSSWFYLQRILCFLIIILMVAGAFNVFQ